MADIASLSLAVNSDQVKQATVALQEMAPAASAAERASQRWGMATKAASQTGEDFARRVNTTIKSLEFQSQQLRRSAAEQERYNALRRAGVTELSAEGIAIGRAVSALQAQRDVTQKAAESTKALHTSMLPIRSLLGPLIAGFGLMKLASVATQALQAAAGLDELAEQLGVTTTFLQASQLSATQNGVKIEQLETAYGKFSQKMGEAADGSKEMIEALDKLGIKNLDAQGKLRPTEALMQEVAKALLKIEDPARRSALAVDFFGKSGTRMLPMLKDLASGSEDMADAARRAGTMIEADVVKQLDEMSDKAAKAGLQVRALFAEFGAPIITASFEKVSGLIEGIIGQLERGRASGRGFWAEVLRESQEQGRMGGLRLSTPAEQEADRLAKLKKELTSPAAQGRESMIQEEIDKLTRQGALDRQASMSSEEDWARRFKLPVVGPVKGDAGGARLSAIKGSGDAAAKAAENYAKLITQLDLSVAAQEKMTAAAGRGEVAYEAMKVKLEAQEKALQIFGKALDENDPRLQQLEERMLKIAQGKAAESFAQGTTALQRENELLEKQIELIGQAPDIIAKEIALIKARQEAEKGGTAITQEAIDARQKVIAQNETLKNQAKELEKANELWMEPVKSALQSIQQTAADAFEKMLETGKFSFEELGQVFKKTITRMIAEFLALATVRPVMSVIVNAISPSMGQQMGLGTGNVGGTGGGLSGIFGGGGISDFLGQTLVGGGENFGPPMAGQSFASLGTSGGLSVGGALGGLAGIGMGAYSLFSGGGSAGSMLGGGASIAGGLVSMLGPMLGLGAAAGPIGLGIGLLGSILPSLFGGGTPEPPTNRAISSLNFSGGQFGQSGGSYGMDAADLGGLGSSMKSLLDAAKVMITSSASGIQQQSYSKGDFSNATTFITGPGGSQMQWGQSSDPAQQQKALDTAGAHVAHQIMLEVGSGISDIMREGLSQFGSTNLQHAFSQEELSTAVAKLNQFEEALKTFNKTQTEAEQALTAIDDSFKTLYETAKEFNLAVAPLDAEKARLRTKVGTDFADLIQRDLMDPVALAMKDIFDEHAARYRENDALKAIEGYVDQAANIDAAYQKKRLAIMEEGNAAALAAAEQTAAAQRELLSAAASSLGNLQALIRQLSPGGPLSNLDPAGQNAGLRASYNASYAQAIADPTNADAISRFTSNAQAFLEYNRSFTGGSTAYVESAAEALQRAQGLQVGVTQAAMNMTADSGTHSRLDTILTAIKDGNVTSADRDVKLDTLLGLLARYLANPAQAA